MNKTFKSTLLSACLLGTTVANAEQAEKLVTVVTSADAQTQLMAMVLAMQSAQQGVDAHILLCGPAGDMALKEAPASVTAPQKPQDMSPQGLMQMIMEKTGTSAEVCAIYLPNAELDQSALLEGITAADPAAMAARLIDDDTTVLSF